MFNKLSLSEQVEDVLREEITEGRVRPGQRISMSSYQQSWNISSTPFRDAVKALEMQGFVVVSPRRGVFVAPMNINTLRELMDLRIALECVAIELATYRVPRWLADDVLGRYEQAGRSAANGDAFALDEVDTLLHDLAREHCGNSRLQRLLESQRHLFRWAQNSITINLPRSFELALPEHLAIMRAVTNRQPLEASAEMRRHLENTRARLEHQLDASSVGFNDA